MIRHLYGRNIDVTLMLSLVRFCPAFLPYGLVPLSLKEANSASSLLELKFRMVSAVFVVIPTCVPHWIHVFFLHTYSLDPVWNPSPLSFHEQKRKETLHSSHIGTGSLASVLFDSYSFTFCSRESDSRPVVMIFGLTVMLTIHILLLLW